VDQKPGEATGNEENLTENHGVGGSIPPLGTKFYVYETNVYRKLPAAIIDNALRMGTHRGRKSTWCLL
jgi:hypothetical protein